MIHFEVVVFFKKIKNLKTSLFLPPQKIRSEVSPKSLRVGFFQKNEPIRLSTGFYLRIQSDSQTETPYYNHLTSDFCLNWLKIINISCYFLVEKQKNDANDFLLLPALIFQGILELYVTVSAASQPLLTRSLQCPPPPLSAFPLYQRD